MQNDWCDLGVLTVERADIHIANAGSQKKTAFSI